MQHSILPSGPVQAHCIRLSPGEDLVPALQDAAKKAIASTPTAGSAFVLSAVGSLLAVTLRLASASRTDTSSESNETRQWNERFEVVSLVGTFTPTGEKHLHISVANAQGNTFGGHLMAGTVFTTLELILGTISDVKFTRELDDKTGYSELVVGRKGPSGVRGPVIPQPGPQVTRGFLRQQGPQVARGFIRQQGPHAARGFIRQQGRQAAPGSRPLLRPVISYQQRRYRRKMPNIDIMSHRDIENELRHLGLPVPRDIEERRKRLKTAREAYT